MGQGLLHWWTCVVLARLLRDVAAPEDAVGADQFVFYDASNPRRRLAPDGFVKRNGGRAPFDSWKIWERGVPELCVEILSPSDAPETMTFEEKLAVYHALGTRELVTFHMDDEPGTRLRIWDRIEGDLVERVVEGERSPCLTLGLHWTLAPATLDDAPLALRLARDAAGQVLVPTPREGLEEARRQRIAAEQARASAEEERDAAKRRIAELEAELKKRRG